MIKNCAFKVICHKNGAQKAPAKIAKPFEQITKFDVRLRVAFNENILIPPAIGPAKIEAEFSNNPI